MTAHRLNGKGLANECKAALAARVAALKERNVIPTLAVLLPTKDDAALAYYRTKQRTAEKLGICVEGCIMADPSTEAMVDQIAAWSADPAISGIMVETPLPPGVDVQAIRNALPAAKDVDGAGTESLGRLLSGNPAFAPATATAALCLAESGGEIAGKHAVIIGRSLVVGRPLALLLLVKDATVTVCHSKTRDLPAISRSAELLFVAVGRPRFVRADMVAPGATVIDIGTNVVDGVLVGDVDADAVDAVAGCLSPVPGGVGPLTTTHLFEHVVQAAEARIG